TVVEAVFLFQAEDGIRDGHVTGVQTCALPISTWSMRRMGGAPWPPSLLRDWVEPVSDPVARLDERVAGCTAVDLVAQSPHEDVDRAVAVGLTATPDLLQQLVAGEDTPAFECQLIEEPELRRSESCALA